jgi:TonB family protein
VTLETPRPDPLQGDQPTAGPAEEVTVVLQAAEDGADDSATMQLDASAVPPADSQTVALPTSGAGADLPEATVIVEVEKDPSGTAATLPPTSTKGVPRPLPAAWLLGGAAVLFVLAASVVVWLLLSRGGAVEPDPVLPSAAPVADVSELPTVGTLLVESEPSGAEVTVNGEARGTTPLELGELPFGQLEVKLALKGYIEQSHDVLLSAESSTAELQATLSKRRPTTGTANFASTPAGATVFVDGKRAGTTPLNGLRLKPGEHDVSLILEGHERWSGSVKVVAGRRARVQTELVAVPEAPPTPEPVDTARIYENTDGDVDRIARKRSGDSPSYPTDRVPRLKSGERVSVTLTFLVNAEGGVEDVEVTESAGKVVDDVVTAAVRSWTYDPATIRETPVKVRIRFRQTFLGG